MAPDPDFSNLVPKMPVVRIPEIVIPPNPVHENLRANLASSFYQRLGSWIADFDASLDDDHEVGARLVTFGQSVVFHLDSLGYCNPSLISFAGTLEDGSPVELVQHVSQISILLMKLPRADTSQPKVPFGFRPPEAATDDEAEAE